MSKDLYIDLVDKRHILLRNMGKSPEKSCKNWHFPNAEKAEKAFSLAIKAEERAGSTICQLDAHSYHITA